MAPSCLWNSFVGSRHGRLKKWLPTQPQCEATTDCFCAVGHLPRRGPNHWPSCPAGNTGCDRAQVCRLADVWLQPAAQRAVTLCHADDEPGALANAGGLGSPIQRHVAAHALWLAVGYRWRHVDRHSENRREQWFPIGRTQHQKWRSDLDPANGLDCATTQLVPVNGIVHHCLKRSRNPRPRWHGIDS